MKFTTLQVQDARDHIITAFLLILALVLMVNRHRGGLENLRKVSIATVSYLEEPLANIRVYRQALKTNEHLHQQNVLLMDEINRLRSVKKQNEILRKMLTFRDTTKLDLLPVIIVSKDLTGLNNTLTVDAGSDDSVKIGMPLVTSDGLVGRVVIVARHFSEVMPFNNMMFRVSSTIQGVRAYGVVSWNGKNIDKLTMNYVPQTIRVDTGMIVQTSGYSDRFPPNIPIGKVIGTQPEEGKETQKIFLKPFVSLNQLAEGFIVRYEPDSTITRLHDKMRDLY
ncbi:MAG TPA: rod shape-determining protein MreC [Balneolales bacterium]|nr:rod shape-determining protein MreC [Balneolales bacterium]